MPNFGDPAEIVPGGVIYGFTFDDWMSWYARRFVGEVPARVLWEPKSGCVEKYVMVEVDVEVPV